MAEFKKKILVLTSGKQVKLYGNSLAIGKSLEIGEGYAPNVFAAAGDGVTNPHHLTTDELMEIADYVIQLWMDLKNNLRKHGLESGKVFNSEGR
jgi:hypothetical protein